MSGLIRGTRIIEGKDAEEYSSLLSFLSSEAREWGFEEIILPALWSQQTFVEKAGEEILNQMYAFEDKKGRPICLIPEATALVAETYKESWAKFKPRPYKIFYTAKCYRYERPQEGRYREFTQFGVEVLGGKSPDDKNMLTEFLLTTMKKFDIKEWSFNEQVKRGLDYYVEDGFEIEVPSLGAQKQVCGGGRYDCGIGFAFGIDRMLLSMEK